jgi:hypothetical protein
VSGVVAHFPRMEPMRLDLAPIVEGDDLRPISLLLSGSTGIRGRGSAGGPGEEEMMPNRILRDTIRTSEEIDQLSPDEEVFWYRLITACDDFGRFDGRPAVIRAALYPLRLDRVAEKAVAKHLDRLVALGMVERYTNDGKPYIWLVKWDDNQRVKTARAKFPGPEDTGSIRGNVGESGRHVPANLPVSESESNPNPIYLGEADAPPLSPNGKKQRKPNPLFDAMVEVMGWETWTNSQAADIGKTLREVKEADQRIGCETSADDIRTFASFWADGDRADYELTPRVFRNHWASYRNGKLLLTPRKRR